jgi:hypothetical protein
MWWLFQKVWSEWMVLMAGKRMKGENYVVVVIRKKSWACAEILGGDTCHVRRWGGQKMKRVMSRIEYSHADSSFTSR